MDIHPIDPNFVYFQVKRLYLKGLLGWMKAGVPFGVALSKIECMILCGHVVEYQLHSYPLSSGQ